MLVKTEIRVDGWHKPSKTWHTYRSPHGVRAVSIKAGLNKSLKYAIGLPCYQDRVNHEDWEVSAEAKLDTQKGMN